MLALIKWMMTLNNLAAGYKTYILALVVVIHALAGIATTILEPLAAGDLSLWAATIAITKSPYITEIIAAFGAAFLRRGAEPTPR